MACKRKIINNKMHLLLLYLVSGPNIKLKLEAYTPRSKWLFT